MERSDLDYASATEIARLVRTRQISAADVTEHAIARIEARNRSINAFVYTDFEQARNRAKDLDVRIRAGEDVGPLAGVPTAIKDLFNFYPGWPSTLGGIRCLRDFKLDVKSRYATKMEEAGAVVLGITNSPVLGFRGTTDNDLYGPTRNPFDLSRNSGCQRRSKFRPRGGAKLGHFGFARGGHVGRRPVSRALHVAGG